MNNFAELELTPQLLKGVDAAGFAKPFPIQERAITPLLAGLDVIGQAKTGTGKTAAYGLPLLQTLNTRAYQVQALVLSPTRELAVQIAQEIRKLGMFVGANILTVYGGQSIKVQFEGLRKGAHVIVGTPGRVIDHIKRGTLRLDRVKFAVLDEADTMLEMGFIDDIEFILNCAPDHRQLSLFSATMPQRIIELSKRYMQSPQRILVDSDEPSVDELEQYYAVVDQDLKLRIIVDILARERGSSVMIFCNTKRGARRLAAELDRRHLNAVPLHGDLSQRQRDRSMHIFRSGRADILVATDVASRGIDIRRVGCVISYHVPENPLLYFHRIGRTARAGDSGKAYTLVSREEFGDFARIRNLTKAMIRPLRPEDDGHAFLA
ncbi:MAG: DEAD/DEAH box helicase, partial [Candidatus Bathyarchaeia archaeon]